MNFLSLLTRLRSADVFNLNGKLIVFSRKFGHEVGRRIFAALRHETEALVTVEETRHCQKSRENEPT